MTTITSAHFRILLEEVVKSARMEGVHAKTPITYILENRTETLADGLMRELDAVLNPVKREPATILDHTSAPNREEAPKIHVHVKDHLEPERSKGVSELIRQSIVVNRAWGNPFLVKSRTRDELKRIYKNDAHRSINVCVLKNGSLVYGTRINTGEL